MTIQALRDRLQGVTGGDTRFTARCPAHDDRQNSLSVGMSDDGMKILLNCFAGCSAEKITESLGLTVSDLFAEQAAPQKAQTAERTYEYPDENGILLYTKTRVDMNDGTKSFFFKQPDGTKGVKGIRRVPYKLPAVLAAQAVYIVEGEKCADALMQAGRTATTLDSGAKSKWLPEYAAYFAGKTVTIIPDNDAPGMEYAKQIAGNIPGSRIVTLPDLDPKEDIYDWLKAGHTMDELDALPVSAPTSKAGKEPRVTQAEILLKLVNNIGADFFHSDMNDLYAMIPVAQHTEIWALEGNDFSTWLHGLYYRDTGRPVNNEAVGQAVAVLSARARFDKPEPVTLSTRVAESKTATGDTAIWYDLSNSAWQAIEITETGWKLHDNPPVRFNRYRHQAAQIMPIQGGDIRKILDYINIKNNHTLFLCWLITCFIPGFPHVMPIFYGEKGAAKSTTCSLLKMLIDPSALDTMTLQNDPRALAVNLQQHWFLPFDNVSYINEESSDTLCRAITGSGIQQRKLFTNADDTIFMFKRCLAINGINNVATRSDLLDRSLLVELERISETDRRELADIQAAFERDRPSMLGGILDTLVQAMKIFPSVRLASLPRMADFARWGYAIGEALGGFGQTFLYEYAANRESQNTEAINADSVATLVVEFMRGRDEWDGSVSDFYGSLTAIAADHNISTKNKAFPADPARLSRRLNSIKSNLEAVGICFTGYRRSGNNCVSLRSENLPPLAPRLHKSSNCNSFNSGGKEIALPLEILTSTTTSTQKPLRRNDYGVSGANGAKNVVYRGRI